MAGFVLFVTGCEGDDCQRHANALHNHGQRQSLPLASSHVDVESHGEAEGSSNAQGEAEGHGQTQAEGDDEAEELERQEGSVAGFVLFVTGCEGGNGQRHADALHNHGQRQSLPLASSVSSYRR